MTLPDRSWERLGGVLNRLTSPLGRTLRVPPRVPRLPQAEPPQLSASTGSVWWSLVALAPSLVVAQPAPAEVQPLLEHFPVGARRLLQTDGVQFEMWRTGQTLGESHLVQGRSLPSYLEQSGSMRKQADAYHRAGRPFQSQLVQVEQRIQALGPVTLPAYELGSGLGPPRLDAHQKEWVRLQSQQSELLSQKREAQQKSLPPGALIAPFHLAEQTMNLGEKLALQAREERPRTREQMALEVGATQPEQFAEYSRLLEAINGPRLKEAERAGHGLIDCQRYDILVPDLFYQSDGQGGSLRLNRFEAVSARQWLEGKLLGQYFPESRKIVIRHPLPDLTVSHEVAHALEAAVQRHDPNFYREWSQRRQHVFADWHGSVTFYAGTNPEEYTAEGMAYLLEQPTTLKDKDPRLFQLTQELLERASSLGL